MGNSQKSKKWKGLPRFEITLLLGVIANYIAPKKHLLRVPKPRARRI